MATKPEVRELLRAAILRGTYAPRQRLIEADLAQEYGASRFTLRNALIQLAADGLVELQPNRGARVREITVDEAIEITEIRQAVESIVAARAAERATDEQIAFLQSAGEDMKAALAEGQLIRYSELNTLLHSTLREIAQHGTADRILDLLNGQLVRQQFRLFLLPGRPSTSLPEHLAIIDAVSRHDADAAYDAMRAHTGSVIATLSTWKQEQQTENGA